MVKKGEYQRRWYEKNKEKRKQQIADRKRRILKWIRDYKADKACCRCGEDHPACLEFHHRDPSSKDIPIAEAHNKGWSIERIQNEIDKCDILCANCHAKEHYKY